MLELNSTVHNSPYKPPLPRYNVTIRHRDRYQEIVCNRLKTLEPIDTSCPTIEGIDARVEGVTKIIRDACTALIKNTHDSNNIRRKGNTWWSENLHIQKKRVMALKRLMKNTLNDDMHFETIAVTNPFTGPYKIDLPCQQWYCHPAQVRLEKYEKTIPDSSIVHTIYTDGSKTEDMVGAGWCLYHRNSVILERSYVIPEKHSVFQAEGLAIFKALEWFSTQSLNHIAIASDSLSSLEALSSPFNKSWTVIRNEITIKNIIESGKTISFHWVKAHVRLEGNERADSLARNAYKYPSPFTPLPIPKSAHKKNSFKNPLSEWQQSW
ncbi:hypothetical protein LAZ67_3004430 [Cordylochernes scorpioides]|uniref:ribonuclease H n=1 Tax=Cordylochernes scorpioides TaxID=51811 RepID=A0ABY6KB52_9ARAC|nr:hypothetical protein LAZ67_3004430 [Cordylochernes scorpioides]